MDPSGETRKRGENGNPVDSPKLVACLLSPLVLAFIKGEPGLLISLMSLLQGILLRVKALQGRRRVSSVESRYLWVFPLGGLFVFLLLGQGILQPLLLVLIYLISLLLKKKHRLPFYMLLQGILFQGFFVPEAESSFNRMFLPALYGLLMMLGGLGLLERNRK